MPDNAIDPEEKERIMAEEFEWLLNQSQRVKRPTTKRERGFPWLVVIQAGLFFVGLILILVFLRQFVARLLSPLGG